MTISLTNLYVIQPNIISELAWSSTLYMNTYAIFNQFLKKMVKKKKKKFLMFGFTIKKNRKENQI